LAAEKRLIDCLVALAAEGVLESAHDISDGGLAVALAESCFASNVYPASAVGAGLAPPASDFSSSLATCHSPLATSSFLGATVTLNDDTHSEFALFNERGARAIVSVSPKNLAAVLDTARQYGVAAREIGQVTGSDAFRIEHKGRGVIESPVETLRDAWADSLERAVKST
jgi:phosphoribosylformylglycinamidine synthase